MVSVSSLLSNTMDAIYLHEVHIDLQHDLGFEEPLENHKEGTFYMHGPFRVDILPKGSQTFETVMDEIFRIKSSRMGDDECDKLSDGAMTPNSLRQGKGKRVKYNPFAVVACGIRFKKGGETRAKRRQIAAKQ